MGLIHPIRGNELQLTNICSHCRCFMEVSLVGSNSVDGGTLVPSPLTDLIV